MEPRFSHPAHDGRDATLLKDHLRDVAERASRSDFVPGGKQTVCGTTVNELVARLGWIHDLGKATTWFQQYIDSDREDPRGKPTHHAPLGALLGYYVLDVTDHEPVECLAGYVAVASHHGRLPNVARYVYDRTNWSNEPSDNRIQREIANQVDDIDEHVPELANEIVGAATDGAGSWDEVHARIKERSLHEEVKTDVTYTVGADPRALPDSLYETLLQCWSGLTLADKTSAARAPLEGYEPTYPDRTCLKSYIDDLGSDAASERESQLNDLRGSARADVLEGVDEFVAGERDLATLTLPTGLGKTLTGLDAAFRIRDVTDRSQVVYALPFTSIIDQVVDEVKDVFDVSETEDALTVHHHLADTVVELDETDEATDERADVEALLGESWRSGLVVTTFVQLFESLVGPTNSQSLKLPALYDSVVVLDEPQGLPHNWWPLVRRVCEILTDEYGAAVIAMTATQPKLFGGDATELVEDRDRYFRSVERVEYTFDDSVRTFTDDPSPLPLDRAATHIGGHLEDGTSTLTVCNTIDSARALTEELERAVGGTDLGSLYADLVANVGRPSTDELVEAALSSDREPLLAHLSTRLRPVDRARLVGAIKELRERGVPVGVVSTQLIEAGVDVSFDRVFRDLAPLDSVVQAAGRCNRSFELEQGTVTVWWLDSDEETDLTPAEAVYEQWGDSLLSVTVDVLASLGAFDADNGPDDGVPPATVADDAVDEYYRRLSEERDVGSREYVDYLDNAECETAGALSLIDETRSVDVVVGRTAAERELLESISQAWAESDYDELEAKIEQTKPLRVSVQAYDDADLEALSGLNTVHDEAELRWTAPSQPEFKNWFDETKGLVVPDSTVEGRFL